MLESFCRLFISEFSLLVWFVLLHSTIILLRSICTILYYIAVRICVQRIMIIFLHWHKYSAPPCNTSKSGGSRHFLLTNAPQEPTAVIPIWWPLLLVIPYQPCPIYPVLFVNTIQPVASQFLSFYHPAHKNPISTSKTEWTNMIQALPLNSKISNPNT